MTHFRPVPKPQKPERGTARAKRHMDLVSQTTCACCKYLGHLTPIHELHHWIMGRGRQGKTSDLEVIGLCKFHHDMLHHNRSEWLDQFGSEDQMRIITEKMIQDIKRNTI